MTASGMSARKGLGQFLQEKGLVTPPILQKALQEQERSGLPLRTVLLTAGVVTEEHLLDYYETVLAVPRLDIDVFPLDPEAALMIPEEVARRHGLIGAFCVENSLTIIMTDPLSLVAQDEVRRITGKHLEIGVASTEAVTKALDTVYARGGRPRAVAPPTESKIDLNEEGAIIRLVDNLVLEASRDGASDIHIEPEEDHLKIRYRTDGILREIVRHPLSLVGAITARIKVMADLDLAEKRRPQDGRARVTKENLDIDLRVSTFPTLYGENTVMRLLERKAELASLARLGFSDEVRQQVVNLIERPHGLFLVTGPTGSGKTTTLYACLGHLNDPERNIATLEDPVEFRLANIRQTQIDAEIELTFARGLRALLRQDPDIIMVGEIRDSETAEIAIRSALTGHLVLSTLHTNDAIGALVRFADMGTEAWLVVQATVGVMGQRLMRAICPRCSKPAEAPAAVLKRLRLDAAQVKGLKQGAGCGDCHGSGYRGRVGIYELLIVDDAIREAVCAGAPAGEIERIARRSGFRNLAEDAMARALAGQTTLEEVLRVTGGHAGNGPAPVDEATEEAA